MLKKFRLSFLKNIKTLGLFFLFILTVVIVLHINQQKNLSSKKYNNLFENIYLKKTLKEIINKLEPRYKKYNHKIQSGETFDKILKDYSINNEEILEIKESLIKKVNINKLNTNQKIQFIVDQTNNKIIEFVFQISNKEKIYLSRDNQETKFNEETLTIKLDKKIIFKENTILQSLYKAATDQNISPNIIIEFARIYGFQVDFQRDIRKKINFKLCMKCLLIKIKKLLKLEKLYLPILNLVVKIILYITLIKKT